MSEETEIKCRRCSECVGSEHHWLSDPRPDVDDDATDEQIAAAPYVWQCKHCPATKPYDPDDPEMYGDGYDDLMPGDEDGEDDDQLELELP